MPLGILYHDARMAAVYKPCGMLSVPGKGNMPSVQSEIVRLFPHAQGPIMVHRLDMDTAGVMAVALTWEAYHTLPQAFVHRQVSKTYRALLEHAMPIGMQGTIDLPLRPDVTDRPRQTVDISHGRHAVTHYRVLDNIRGHALVELKPLTGRTHQLRVHCAHPQGLGNPILGDRLYALLLSPVLLSAVLLLESRRVFSAPSRSCRSLSPRFGFFLPAIAYASFASCTSVNFVVIIRYSSRSVGKRSTNGKITFP